MAFLARGRDGTASGPHWPGQLRYLRAAFAFVCSVLGVTGLTAQTDASRVRPPQGVMVSLTNVLEFHGQILHGEPALVGQWPATFVFGTNTDAEGSCTATAVGRRVILTAAHCVEDGSDLWVSTSSQNIPLTCDRNPSYDSDHQTADYALCVLDRPLPNLGEGFERVNADGNLARGGKSLLLIGYGCTTVDGVLDFGHLYQGFATVEDSSSDPPRGPNQIAVLGGAAICSGDSGGGAYWEKSEHDITGSRLLVAINAKSNLDTVSVLTRTDSNIFLQWARKWASERNVAICGVVGEEDHCRN